jgi:hypothetical protein
MGTLNSRPMPKHTGLYINSLEIHAGTWSSLLSRGKRDVMRTLIVAGKLVLPGSCPGRCRLRDTVRRIPIPTAGARRVPITPAPLPVRGRLIGIDNRFDIFRPRRSESGCDRRVHFRECRTTKAVGPAGFRECNKIDRAEIKSAGRVVCPEQRSLGSGR